MYIPSHFAEKNEATLIEHIRSAPLGALVIFGSAGFEANHLPFVFRRGPSEPGVLCAHVPRSNPLSAALARETPCLVIFGGPEGYVSPSWYATKKEHGRVVPTWNYSVVHAHGHAVVIDDPDWVLNQINELTSQRESVRLEPWAVSDAPGEFTRALVSSLVGLKISIERLEGKTKASQNQPDRNRASVLEALLNEQPETAFTQFMRKVHEQGDSAE